MKSAYTENLADFGARERKMAAELLACDLPDGFDNTGVKVAMNRNSGYVFLVNEDYQCAMMNGDKLELFHNLPYGGEEGFLLDLMQEHEPSDLHHDDAEYIIEAYRYSDLDADEIPAVWYRFEREDAGETDEHITEDLKAMGK